MQGFPETGGAEHLNRTPAFNRGDWLGVRSTSKGLYTFHLSREISLKQIGETLARRCEKKNGANNFIRFTTLGFTGSRT